MQEMRHAGKATDGPPRLLWAKLMPLSAAGPIGERYEHLEDILVSSGAWHRRRLIRALDVVILELGVLQTLKRFKDEVNDVQSGQECGMAFAGFQDIKAGDVIECFTLEEVKRSL